MLFTRKERFDLKEFLLKDYVVALTNHYGIVNKAKVVEIYNMQNEVKITERDLLTVPMNVLEKGFVSIHRDYFVNDSILEFDEFDLMMAKKGDKPYYLSLIHISEPTRLGMIS